MPGAQRKTGQRRANPPRSDLAQKRITQTLREAEALRLKIAGHSYESIAVEMGYRTRSGAWRAVKEALRKTIQEPADEVRQIELTRLDAWLVAIHDKILAGDMFALDRGLKIMTQRTFYITGLKVPEKIAPTTPDGSAPYPGEGLAALLTLAQRTPHADSNGIASHSA